MNKFADKVVKAVNALPEDTTGKTWIFLKLKK
jgi:hypothetical protein